MIVSRIAKHLGLAPIQGAARESSTRNGLTEVRRTTGHAREMNNVRINGITYFRGTTYEIGNCVHLYYSQ